MTTPLANGLSWYDKEDNCVCYVCLDAGDDSSKDLLCIDGAPHPNNWICVPHLVKALSNVSQNTTDEAVCNNCGETISGGDDVFCGDCSIDSAVNRCDNCNDDGQVLCSKCAAEEWPDEEDHCTCENCGDEVYWRLCDRCYNKNIDQVRADSAEDIECDQCSRQAEYHRCTKHPGIECDECNNQATHGYCSMHWEQSTQSVSPKREATALPSVTVSEDGNTVTLDDGVVIQF